MKDSRLLISPGRNVHSHLAVEEFFLNNLDADQAFILFYRNDPSVVIGKHQNPWKESNPYLLKQEHIALARRISGGGTVYHDPGNLNFAFVAKADSFDKVQNLRLIQQTLSTLGIETELNEHCDILHQGRKVSGSSCAIRKGKTLQHGTLLIGADLDTLERSLQPAIAQINDKSVLSRKSRVTNLDSVRRHLSPEMFIEAFRQKFRESFDSELYPETKIPSIEQSKYYSKQTSFDWIYGHTPDFRVEFSNQFSWHYNAMEISVSRGFIHNVEFDGPLPCGLVNKIAKQFTQSPFDSEYLAGRMAQEFTRLKSEEEFYRWFSEIKF